MTKFLFIFVLTTMPAVCSLAQSTTTDTAKTHTDSLRPYQKYPSLPAFNILEMDSTTIFNTYNIPKGKPVAIVFFDPECKHCKRTMKRLTSSMDSVKNVSFYFVTPHHYMGNVKKFYEEHHLGDYKNVQVVGRDYEFFFFSYYGTKYLPDIVIYDANKKLVKLIEGEFSATDIYGALH